MTIWDFGISFIQLNKLKNCYCEIRGMAIDSLCVRRKKNIQKLRKNPFINNNLFYKI